MNNQFEAQEELKETRSVNEANRLLRGGWKLLSIERNCRGHIYILHAQTAQELPPSGTALPESPNRH